jgi:D-alanine-D-alanine ligase-like ATP-grasp enzyme
MSQLPYLVRILTKIAPTIGATVLIDSEWHITGQITFKNGRKRYFRSSSFDLNLLGASEIATDKDFAYFFMGQMGYPVVPHSKTFFSESWGNTIHVTDRTIDHAYQHALQIGWPVIVKPNSGSLGKGVAKVYSKEQFYASMQAIFAFDRVALVQSLVSGKDYRIVVLDSHIISAYQRIPLNITGDGQSTITELVAIKQGYFIDRGRSTSLHLTDPRIIEKLQLQNLKLDSVLDKDRQVFLLDNANLSSGGDSIDVTDSIHPLYKDKAIQLTHDMGLRLCGVDLMINGDIAQAPNDWWVLEINAAPGLDHYAKSGALQQQVVEDMYLEVLKAMEKEAL